MSNRDFGFVALGRFLTGGTVPRNVPVTVGIPAAESGPGPDRR